MNYLGHLFLSGNDISLMRSNLYGDFVKGAIDKQDVSLWKGLTLHRAIDDFTDNHPAVKELLTILRPQLPKVAGIAVDLYFDHLLAKNWSKFHPQNYSDYLSTVYLHFSEPKPHYSSDFETFLTYFTERKWLNHYPFIEGLDKLSNGVASRLSFPNDLIHGVRIFQANETAITTAFELFITDAIQTFLTEELRIMS